MFIGPKTEFETPLPEFNLKTPKNSPSITQITSISKIQLSNTQFFSVLLHNSNEETPFRTCSEEFPRSNSGRKLTIMEEQEKTPDNETKKIMENVLETTTAVAMDLTQPCNTLQDSQQSNDNHEDNVKKVRFSDHYKTAAEIGSLMESCVRTVLNMDEEEEFHDAHNKFNAQKVKVTEKGAKDAKNTEDVNSMRDTSIVEDKMNTNDNQAEDKNKKILVQPLENFLNNSQIKIIYDNSKNVKKENRDPEESNKDLSMSNQRDSNRVLMMVLMESNSGGLSTDLMPLISSGLKKLQEQLILANRQSSSNATESANVRRRSVTTMKMSVESVESYSMNNPTTIMNHEQLPSSSSTSVVRNSENSNNSGFLSAVAQAMKHAFRSLSGQ